MSALLLLGVIRGAAEAPDQAPAHRRVRSGRWSAIALDVDPNAASEQDDVLAWATAQNAILAAYISRGDVLPVTLGAVFSSEQALKAYIIDTDRALVADAERLKGLCEYALSIENVAAAAPEALNATVSDGRGFLLARQQRKGAKNKQSQARTALINDMLTLIRDRGATVLSDPPRAAERLGEFKLLIARKAMAGLLSDLSAFGPGASALGLDCRMVGPSPAYSFVGQEAAVA